MTKLDKPGFITVDGADGSGKSTVVNHIVKRLEEAGISNLFTPVLQGGPAGREVYKRMLGKKEHKEEDLSFILGMATCIQETYEDRVLPALEEGFVFICDRYLPSYYSYQAAASGSMLAKQIHQVLYRTMTRRPDLYLFLDVDTDISIQRLSHRKNQSDILDQKARTFKEAVILGYRADFIEHDSGWRVRINANQSTEDVLRDVDVQIDKFIELRNRYDK